MFSPFLHCKTIYRLFPEFKSKDERPRIKRVEILRLLRVQTQSRLYEPKKHNDEFPERPISRRTVIVLILLSKMSEKVFFEF